MLEPRFPCLEPLNYIVVDINGVRCLCDRVLLQVPEQMIAHVAATIVADDINPEPYILQAKNAQVRRRAPLAEGLRSRRHARRRLDGGPLRRVVDGRRIVRQHHRVGHGGRRTTGRLREGLEPRPGQLHVQDPALHVVGELEAAAAKDVLRKVAEAGRLVLRGPGKVDVVALPDVLAARPGAVLEDAPVVALRRVGQAGEEHRLLVAEDDERQRCLWGRAGCCVRGDGWLGDRYGR